MALFSGMNNPFHGCVGITQDHTSAHNYKQVVTNLSWIILRAADKEFRGVCQGEGVGRCLPLILSVPLLTARPEAVPISEDVKVQVGLGGIDFERFMPNFGTEVVCFCSVTVA